uniref:C-methyltransferase domain-containing protein n=1 Tax=viral metagenome TaxID=1070528 RepID=A0A6C0KU67_9ZZZZ
MSFNSNCIKINECLCCLEKITELLDLNEQPLANNFHNINEEDQLFPLKLNYCKKCFHCQLSHSINPEILFKNYKYLSGTSNTGMIFFKDNAKFINEYKNIENGNILDIACNDGTQLDCFKDLNWNTYGVDPAENLFNLTKNKGHNIICGFWNIEIAKQLPKMDVILAQNVFAHTQNVDDFLQSCKFLMKNTTSLFIQTSQKNMILNNEFDTIYHEHISFFNSKSMNELVNRNGLKLNNVFENDIHGTSYIFEIKLDKNNSSNIDKIFEDECVKGLYNIKTYLDFSSNAKNCLKNLINKIDEYRNKNYKCIGFGASAKGQTVICYGDIILDYIIDENPLKIGLYSPKLNIPVVSVEHFNNDKFEKFLIIILAWNFSKEIIDKIMRLNKMCEIIIIKNYFPNIKIISNK